MSLREEVAKRLPSEGDYHHFSTILGITETEVTRLLATTALNMVHALWDKDTDYCLTEEGRAYAAEWATESGLRGEWDDRFNFNEEPWESENRDYTAEFWPAWIRSLHLQFFDGEKICANNKVKWLERSGALVAETKVTNGNTDAADSQRGPQIELEADKHADDPVLPRLPTPITSSCRQHPTWMQVDIRILTDNVFEQSETTGETLHLNLSKYVHKKSREQYYERKRVDPPLLSLTLLRKDIARKMKRYDESFQMNEWEIWYKAKSGQTLVAITSDALHSIVRCWLMERYANPSSILWLRLRKIGSDAVVTGRQAAHARDDDDLSTRPSDFHDEEEEETREEEAKEGVAGTSSAAPLRIKRKRPDADEVPVTKQCSYGSKKQRLAEGPL